MSGAFLCFQDHTMVRDGRKKSFIRESIQGDEQITATFRTSPEIMADVTTYDWKELFVILFNHVANFLSVGSGGVSTRCRVSR